MRIFILHFWLKSYGIFFWISRQIFVFRFTVLFIYIIKLSRSIVMVLSIRVVHCMPVFTQQYWRHNSVHMYSIYINHALTIAINLP